MKPCCSGRHLVEGGGHRETGLGQLPEPHAVGGPTVLFRRLLPLRDHVGLAGPVGVHPRLEHGLRVLLDQPGVEVARRRLLALPHQGDDLAHPRQHPLVGVQVGGLHVVAHRRLHAVGGGVGRGGADRNREVAAQVRGVVAAAE